jgi:serine/threonine protein kinase
LSRNVKGERMAELSGTRLGEYQLLEDIGRGGMAVVYEGRHVETGRKVAVKVLHPQLAIEPNFKTRFKREAEVLSSLDHPSIAPILAYGEAQGQMYIVMPFMDIGSLSDRLEGGPLNVEEGAEIITQISSALQYAHEAGVVHRDVKPSNILVDDEGCAKLADFGFAHIVDASLSLTGSALIGTPAYMSPEQIQGGKISPKTDQYALGVVLYQISTGYLPYDGDTPIAVAIKHATQPLPRPRAVNPKLPDAVERVIIRAMSKEPQDRFASVAAFNDAFQTALEQSIDPASGSFKPGALSPLVEEARSDDAGSDVLKTQSLHKESVAEPERPRRWALALLLLLLLVACPASIWLYTRVQGNDRIALAVGTEDVQATVYALGTANAPRQGTERSPGEVQTIVAATLTALASVTEMVEIKLPGGRIEKDGTRTTEEAGGTPPATSTVDATATASPTSTTVEASGSGDPATASPTATVHHAATDSPTSTPTSTVSWTVTPSPTYTTQPTSTATPTPSLIPPSPTPSKTPTADVCGAFGLGSFDVDGQQVQWRITNKSAESVRIDEIYLNWPGINGGLVKIELGGDAIWDKKDDSPPTHITSGWKSGVSRTIGAGQSRILMFQFDNEAKKKGYKLHVGLDIGCTIEG